MYKHKFIAHCREADGKEQSVCEHLEDVSVICRCFAQKMDVPDVGELLGLLHDFGKYSKQFQSYIKSATGILNFDIDDEFVDAQTLRGKIDHSSAGAQWIWEKFRRYGPQGGLVGQILALCLASHHGGLIDCLKPEGKNGFIARMKKNVEKTHLKECENNMDVEVLRHLDALASPRLIQECSHRILNLVDPKRNQTVTSFNIGFFARFLFSCLIDADRMNSADFENPDNQKLRQQKAVDWQSAIKRFENHLATLPVKSEKIDPIRRSISEKCKEKAAGAQGIYTFTVPTGGGKTFASMRYALHHAHQHQLDHIIYIIPYTSIIEQNAQAIREAIEVEGDEYPWILEHHSNLEPERQTWRDKLIAENWDSPVIFTTMVQFLDALFSGGTRGARRMHQLARSVLIFDEIQTLPINCVHLFCNAINFLVSQAGTTVVLCTATQPLLDKLKAPDKGQLNIPKENELVCNVAELFDQLRRVRIDTKGIRPQGWTESELADLAVGEFNEKGNCLAVVNTKDWAQRLYETCRSRVEKGSLFHLSTSLCPAHRKKILDQVRQRLDDELPVLCISTQLIEAGVDVDFASVIRFLAGLDSIAQAAGRCNRNGRLPQATVHVVNPQEEQIDMLHDIKEGRDKALRVFSEKSGANLLDPDVMNLYFSYYFYSRSNEMVYPVSANQVGRQDSLLSLLSDNHLNVAGTEPLQLRQSFSTAGKIFKAIDAPTEAVIVPYEEGKEIIAGLCAVPEPAKAYQLLKRAQKFSVNVFPNIMRKLKEKRAIWPVQQGEEIYYLDERYYSQEFGLSTKEVSTMQFQNG
ncbi:MAG: CRISPR-associated endonuclease Cas3'' [Thermodesulfobacteriota bacterium]